MKSILSLLLFFCWLNSTAQILNDCSQCSNQIIKEAQIKDLSYDEIRFLTNDLFARKGYQFQNSNIQIYYDEKEWYQSISDNTKIKFTSIEQQNIDLFQKKTTALKLKRENILLQLTNFKEALLQKKFDILKAKYNFKHDASQETAASDLKYLVSVFETVKIDEIGWQKHIGLNTITQDNITETITCQIKIDGDMVYLMYDYDTGSTKFPNDLYPLENFSEYTYHWEFEFKNNQLLLVRMIMAG